ncbi:MAG: tyrosine-protein phosphatase [Bacilli bacterium]|nr:tyrosine-protein phosphatase [Bacilli bacterium]
MPRSIQFDKIENFRDLGGYECRYGETRFGTIYRSAKLNEASPRDTEKLKTLGIKTVLDLRDDHSKEAYKDVTRQIEGIRHIELPVNGNGRICHEYDDYVYSYIEMLEDPYSARNIFKAILHADKPMVIHCNAGKDRTGAFTMIILLLNGVSFKDINADYMASFPYLEDMTADTRANHKEVPELLLTPNIQFLRDVYALFLKKYGDLESYFDAIGLSDDEVRSLSSILGKREKSCGAVVFYKGKVLVEHMAMGHFSIPKGHVEEEDKDEFATAAREIKEETGLDVKFHKDFRITTDYSPKDGVIKQVVWFIAVASSDKVTVQPEEVQDAYWISPADAMIALSHDSDRQVVHQASLYEAEHHFDY